MLHNIESHTHKIENKPIFPSIVALHTPGLHGKNIQATRCVPGEKSRVKAVTLFVNPPFGLTPNEAKRGRPY